MQNIIQQTIEIFSTGFEKNIKNLLETGQDISEFILETQKDLNSVGLALIKEALEKADESVKFEKERKKNWYVKEKAAPNTLATIFGEVHYNRTYYKHKKTGEYKYLSDEMLGISAHDKMDLSLKAKLLEEAVETPYRRSGKKATEALEISGQTVMNTIRELGSLANCDAEYKLVNNEAKILYVEADEDQVSLQDGGCSAEGHICHIYADRISSRPLGWSLGGVDQMARLRVFKKNGGNIYNLMLKKKNELKKEQILEVESKKILKLRNKVACGETLGNIEVLNVGKCSRLKKTLKSLR